MKKINTKNSIQDAINKTLLQNIPISAFKQSGVDVRVKNTVDIYCPSCGSDNVYMELRQTRSGDESQTQYFLCLQCGNKWKIL